VVWDEAPIVPDQRFLRSSGQQGSSNAFGATPLHGVVLALTLLGQDPLTSGSSRSQLSHPNGGDHPRHPV